MMSRLAGFYIAKTIESATANSRTRSPTTSRQVAAAVHRVISGLSRASRTAADWTTSASTRQSPHGSH